MTAFISVLTAALMIEFAILLSTSIFPDLLMLCLATKKKKKRVATLMARLDNSSVTDD